MTPDSLSEPILAIPTSTPTKIQRDLTDEFMDMGGRYVFRAYLSDTPPDEHATELVANTLSYIIAKGGTLSNEQLYDELHTKLCGPEPLERGHLLTFLRMSAQAIRLQLKLRAESSLLKPRPKEQGERPTFAMGSPNSLYLAEQFPEPVLSRLRNWGSFSIAHPNAAAVYELSDFAGCTDAEIAQLLELTPKEVRDRRIHAFSDICKNDPQN